MNAVILTLPARRPRMHKVSEAAIAASYRETRSIWRTAELLGISGQTVQRRLKAAGIDRDLGRDFVSDAEKERVREFYENTPEESFTLANLAQEMGRSAQLISAIASDLGLTKTGRRSAAHLAANRRASKDRWKNSPHPRGMEGKTHTQETKQIVAAASRLNWATWKTFSTGPMSPDHLDAQSKRQSLAMSKRDGSTIYTRSKGGRRDDLGEIYFRSSWEANYARYLNLLIKLGAITSWEYEPLTFWFDGVRRGTNSYRPDFRIHHKNDDRPEYIEIKGWVTPKDRTKWRRMKKYHPTIKLTVVAEKEYRALQRKWSSAIPAWESDRGGGRKLGPRKAVVS